MSWVKSITATKSVKSIVYPPFHRQPLIWTTPIPPFLQKILNPPFYDFSKSQPPGNKGQGSHHVQRKWWLVQSCFHRNMAWHLSLFCPCKTSFQNFVFLRIFYYFYVASIVMFNCTIFESYWCWYWSWFCLLLLVFVSVEGFPTEDWFGLRSLWASAGTAVSSLTSVLQCGFFRRTQCLFVFSLKLHFCRVISFFIKSLYYFISRVKNCISLFTPLSANPTE